METMIVAVGNSIVPYVDDTWDNAFRHDRDKTYSGSDEKSASKEN